MSHPAIQPLPQRQCVQGPRRGGAAGQLQLDFGRTYRRVIVPVMLQAVLPLVLGPPLAAKAVEAAWPEVPAPWLAALRTWGPHALLGLWAVLDLSRWLVDALQKMHDHLYDLTYPATMELVNWEPEGAGAAAAAGSQDNKVAA